MAGDGHRVNMADQIARVATVTVVMLVFICDPENGSMASDEMQRRLKTFLETSAFDSLIGDITNVLEMLRGEPMGSRKWTEELSKVVLSDQKKI
ncbi:hypothetical protein EYR40_002250 [Pleurotus pulmonarius]|nr:hypothetical protein EYR36_002259 [Pleurotus pulmonarius]KAF4583759.1 hypothetical protein EYR40_002250 [Pleurotus pulmonarius]